MPQRNPPLASGVMEPQPPQLTLATCSHHPRRRKLRLKGRPTTTIHFSRPKRNQLRYTTRILQHRCSKENVAAATVGTTDTRPLQQGEGTTQLHSTADAPEMRTYYNGYTKVRQADAPGGQWPPRAAAARTTRHRRNYTPIQSFTQQAPR